MKEFIIEKCPHCKGAEFVKGYGIQAIYPSSLFANALHAGKLEYTVCRECGGVVHIRVMDVEKLI